jgi:hypothetical protein
MIIYVLYSERGCCSNAQNYFAVACSFLLQRQLFVTGDEWSHSDLRGTGIGTSKTTQGLIVALLLSKSGL